MEKSFAELLISKALKGTVDVVVPVKEGQYEPLCACYHVRCIPYVKRVIEGGGGRLIQFFKRVRVDEISEETWKVADPEGKSLINVNTPENMEKVLREIF
jgi:molybdopterin-guanine dinucleotide biosynthesis protein A